jgi:leucyl-tRNA synthetase
MLKLSPAIQNVAPTKEQQKVLHAAIKKVTEDLDGLRFNTAISALMMFVNEAINWPTKPVSILRPFLILLQPLAPHLSEELWSKLASIPDSGPASGAGSNASPMEDLAYAPWPSFDPAFLVETTVEIPVQVNGKLRDVIPFPVDAEQAVLEATALASPKVKPFLEGKTIRKIIVVGKKLINIVAT